MRKLLCFNVEKLPDQNNFDLKSRDYYYKIALAIINKSAPVLASDEDAIAYIVYCMIKSDMRYDGRFKRLTWINKGARWGIYRYLEYLKKNEQKEFLSLNHIINDVGDFYSREYVELFPSCTRNPIDILIEEEDKKDLYQALETLEPRDRQFIECKFFRDMSYVEIGNIFNVTPSSARSRVMTILKLIRGNYVSIIN